MELFAVRLVRQLIAIWIRVRIAEHLIGAELLLRIQVRWKELFEKNSWKEMLIVSLSAEFTSNVERLGVS